MYKYENQARKNQYKLISGTDEVGRGCIAGPLVACLVILPLNYKNNKIKDSKKLTFKQRKELADRIKKDCIAYQLVKVSPIQVDKMNPKRASIWAMEKCYQKISIKPDIIFVDHEKLNLKIKTISITKGDNKSISIAAASIIAKDYRDNIMINLDKKYPNYSFANNKGYLTNKHLSALKKYGPIKEIHRFSYKPIKQD